MRRWFSWLVSHKLRQLRACAHCTKMIGQDSQGNWFEVRNDLR